METERAYSEKHVKRIRNRQNRDTYHSSSICGRSVCDASMLEVENVKGMLRCFETVSSQKITLRKNIMVRVGIEV